MSAEQKMKRCTMCQQVYPSTLDYFHMNDGGLRARCKSCCNAIDRGDLVPIRHVHGNSSQQIRCLICRNYYPATTQFFRRMGRGDEKLRKWCKNCSLAVEHGELVIVDLFKCEDGNKRCTQCFQAKPATPQYFGRGKNGLRSDCKECRTKQHKENGEPTRVRMREWNKLNSKTHVANATRWRKDNFEKYIVQKQRRRARKANLLDTLTVEEWHRALEYFGWRCAVCGLDLTKDMVPAADHWKPLSKGGPTTATNIVPLCHGSRSCNNYKHALMPDVWLKRMLGEEKSKEKLVEIEAYFEWVRQQDKV